MGVAQHGRAVKNVNRELLRKRVRRIAHQYANTEVAGLRVLGDSAGAQQRLGQTASHQPNSRLGERQILSRRRTAAGLLNELRTEHVEVFDLSYDAVDQSAQTRLAGGIVFAEAQNLSQLRVSGAVHHKILRIGRRNLRVEQRRFGKIHRCFRDRRTGRSNCGVRRELRVQSQQVGFDLFGKRHNGGLHIEPQQVRHRQNLGDVRNLERRFRVSVQNDRGISKTRVLCNNRAAFGDVVRHQGRGNRHVYRIARLGQGRFKVAIHQVTHNQVAHQSGECIHRDKLHNRIS